LSISSALFLNLFKNVVVVAVFVVVVVGAGKGDR